VIIWLINVVKNQELADTSALNVVKIYILMIQMIDYHHVANVEIVLSEKDKNIRSG
jgi:hypothetical protein